MPNHMKQCSFNLDLVGRKLTDGVRLELIGDFQNLDTCFSVNFVFESCVAYHFGVALHPDGNHQVFQDCKDGEWRNEPCDECPSDCKKDLIFHLSGEKVEVNLDGQNVFDKECLVPFEQITKIELWDDISWVTGINLKFE